MNEKIIVDVNENAVENINSDKGRKLTAKESTFTLDNGTYRGTITNAFWYKNAEDKDRATLMFELDDGTEFITTVADDRIERYPFSHLISQANIEYIENFVGLRVKFDVRNRQGNAVTFSNIKKISLDV